MKNALLGYEELAYKKTSKKDKEQRKSELLERSILPIYKALLDEESIVKLLQVNIAAQVITELILTSTNVEDVNKNLRPQLVDIIFQNNLWRCA